jgi:hypothetical protein
MKVPTSIEKIFPHDIITFPIFFILFLKSLSIKLNCNLDIKKMYTLILLHININKYNGTNLQLPKEFGALERCFNREMSV